MARRSKSPGARVSKAPPRARTSKAPPRARPSKAPARRSSKRPAASTRKHIVVADDDPSVASMLVRMLENAYDVEWAQDGPGALALVSRDPRPDLLLLDVMMPGFDGFGVAQRMKLIPAARRIPILFITARDAPDDIVRGIQVGARAYITKPFKMKALLEKVRKIVGE
jgi:DNA-binding response OmpR family regulator